MKVYFGIIDPEQVKMYKKAKEAAEHINSIEELREFYPQIQDLVRVPSHMSEDFINQMAEPFHHNFDYDDGHWYKLMLSHCTYNKEKKMINLTMHIPAE